MTIPFRPPGGYLNALATMRAHRASRAQAAHTPAPSAATRPEAVSGPARATSDDDAEPDGSGFLRLVNARADKWARRAPYARVQVEDDTDDDASARFLALVNAAADNGPEAA